MGVPRRQYRMACVDVDAKGIERISMIGIAHVLEMATLGSSVKDIAQYLRVSVQWLQKRMDPDSDLFDPELLDAFDEGEGAFKKRLREYQINLAETNAQMAIHLGKQVLDQHERREVDISARVQLVGTLPDYSQSSDDWKRSFAPSAMQNAKVLEAQAHPHIEFEDGVVLASTKEDKDEARNEDSASD